MNNTAVEVFYAFDDNFAKYAVVSIASMIRTSSPERQYSIHILHTGITEEAMETITDMQMDNFRIAFSDVSDYLASIKEKLPIRDYYTRTTYYRLFIADMVPQYDKAIYIDADTVVRRDIAELYDTEIGEALVGACHEQVMLQMDIYGEYVERVLGISREVYFNAGLLLINSRAWRERRVLEKFVRLLGEYDFVVTQDEDYINVICKDRTYFLDRRWNTEVTEGISHPYAVAEEANIVHFIMANKPWHTENAVCANIFWESAMGTPVYEKLRRELAEYTPEQLEADKAGGVRLAELARSEIERKDNYLARLNEKRDPERVRVAALIEERERRGEFDLDVEDDPPTRQLLPDEIDYLRRSPIAKMKTYIAYRRAKKFLNYIEKQGLMVIKDIRGLENLKNLDTGAVLCANHFNPFDTFAIHRAFLDANLAPRKLYRVIREGNYTSFGGFYGYLMRHFYTLPLSSHPRTMQKMVRATDELLCEGNLVLVYPEQSMWYNYRKPKPLKPGAYRFSVKNDLPVIPIFITMRDSDRIGADGYPIEEYTIHISAPLYPRAELSYKDAIEDLMTRNAEVWREIYESEYGIPLTYTTENRSE